jgi:hypothetical protein
MCQAGEGANDTYENIQKAFGNDSVTCSSISVLQNFVNGC